MSFLKRMGLVASDDEENIEPKESKPIVKTTLVNQINTPVNSEDTVLYSKIIEDALNKRDQPGPDFLEFYKTLKAIEGQPLPEQQKYIMAFTGLQVMGLTKDKIISTSKIYIDEIISQQSKFKESMDQFEKIEIKEKVAKVEKLSKENIELQAKIQSNMSEIATTNGEITQNTQKLNTKQYSFNTEIERETTNINTILNNIKTYIS